MSELKMLDSKLYKAMKIDKNIDEYNKLWNEIKKNKEVLKEAVEVVKDKFNEKDIVNGLTISECILKDYNSININIYNDLIKSIYSNIDIARIVTDGAVNDGISFLLLSLLNHNLKLTSNQKAFAVSEAMNKFGTTLWKDKMELVSKKLDSMGISDDENVYIDIDGEMNPIGRKSGIMYLNEMLFLLKDNQSHGTGSYDIRYYILSNPNWTIEEKQKLINEFWFDQEMYENSLETWEWGIINDSSNYDNNLQPILDKDHLYEYNYNDLLDLFKNKEVVDNIYNEINFCKMMNQLRPMNLELNYDSKKLTK